jgi:uncharacterized protein YoaH (UPF0181 family)
LQKLHLKVLEGQENQNLSLYTLQTHFLINPQTAYELTHRVMVPGISHAQAAAAAAYTLRSSGQQKYTNLFIGSSLP